VAFVVSHRSRPVQGRWILAALVAVLGRRCGGNGEPGEPHSRDGSAEVGDAATDGQADARPTCPRPQPTPSFAKDVKPFLDARCNVCHSTHPRDGGFAPAAQNFETYAGFKPWAAEGLFSVRRGSMPPPESDPALSAADLCMLEAWIDQGAEDN
jgi:uncharacterized membrane protein